MYHNVDVPKYSLIVTKSIRMLWKIYKFSEIKYKRKAKKQTDKKQMGSWCFLFHLLLCLFIFLITAVCVMHAPCVVSFCFHVVSESFEYFNIWWQRTSIEWFQTCITGENPKSNFLFWQILLEVYVMSRWGYQLILSPNLKNICN